MSDTDAKAPETKDAQDTQKPENNSAAEQANDPGQGGVQEPTEVEKLRKQLQQEQMEKNMLRNKLSDKEKAEEEAAKKKLEENEQFNKLYEQEKAAREKLEAELEAKEQNAKKAELKSTVENDFSAETIELARETGIDLADTDEEAVESYKAKLAKIEEKTKSSGKIGGNNPGTPTTPPIPEGDELKAALKDPAMFDDLVSRMPGIAQMMSKKS